jgi:hypothetical protein
MAGSSKNRRISTPQLVTGCPEVIQQIYIVAPLLYDRFSMSQNSEKTDARQSAGWSTGTKVLVGIIALVVILFVLAVMTLSIAVMDSSSGASLPYSTAYRVSLPDGEPVTIGNINILVLTMPDGVDTSVDGSKEKLAVGQERVISPRTARISALGVPLIETDFQITLKYLGASGKSALFDMTVKTSKQIPELVIRRLIPANMNAQPV